MLPDGSRIMGHSEVENVGKASDSADFTRQHDAQDRVLAYHKQSDERALNSSRLAVSGEIPRTSADIERDLDAACQERLRKNSSQRLEEDKLKHIPHGASTAYKPMWSML
jgi:hypothetical protein